MLLALNTNLVSLTGLRDKATRTYVNDAVLAVSLYDENQAINVEKGFPATPITNASGIGMSYRSGSNGEYYGIIPATVQLTIGTNVVVRVTSSNYGIDRTVSVPVQRG